MNQDLINSGDTSLPEWTRKTRILVYDDNESYADECVEALSYRGYYAIRRNSHQTFIEQVRNFAPHYIVLDIHMPGFDGLEALRSLRENAIDVLGIVIFSAAGAELLAAARKIGAAYRLNLLAILDKPFVLEQFEKLIRKAATQDDKTPS